MEWTCCRCQRSNSACTRCNCNHSYCHICATSAHLCSSQPGFDSSPYSTISSADYNSSSSSSPILSYSTLQHEAARPRSTPHPFPGILHSTHPANQLSLIAPFYHSGPPERGSHMTGTMTTIISGGSTTSRRKTLRPRLSINQFKGFWSSNRSLDEGHSDDESFPKPQMSRLDRWWLEL